MSKMKKPDTAEAAEPQVDVATPDTEAQPEANTAPIAPELLAPVPSAEPASTDISEAVKEAVTDLLEAVTDVIKAANDDTNHASIDNPPLTNDPGPTAEMDAPEEPAIDPDKVAELIDRVEWLNQPGHRAGLMDELGDLYGAEKVFVGPGEDVAYVRLAGVDGGYAEGLDQQLQNWCQIARQKLALARDAQTRAAHAAADAEATA